MIRDYAEHVYKVLGPGYSERVYHNLRADLILNNKTVIELKSVKNVTDVMVTQAQNYLRLTGFPEAYLVNFPPCPNSSLEIRYIDSSCT